MDLNFLDNGMNEHSGNLEIIELFACTLIKHKRRLIKINTLEVEVNAYTLMHFKITLILVWVETQCALYQRVLPFEIFNLQQ